LNTHPDVALEGPNIAVVTTGTVLADIEDIDIGAQSGIVDSIGFQIDKATTRVAAITTALV
jgi:hypothetical protein